MCLVNSVIVGYGVEEPSHGRESTDQWKSGKRLNSIVDVQGHMVYDDSGNLGYENYAIFLRGDNGFSISRIGVKIYVTALYYRKIISMATGNAIITTFWDAPPINLVTWDGDMDYGASTPGTWSYTVGGQYKSFTFSATYTPSAYCIDYPKVNPPVEGTYRYLGYFNSRYNNGGHTFKACVRLHVNNDVAMDWASGVITYINPGVNYCLDKILSMRVKVVFSFYSGIKWFWWYTWTNEGTHSHLMGDGVNPDNNDIDIASIPLVVGSC